MMRFLQRLRTPSSWLLAWLIGGLLSLAVLLAYWPELRGPFVFDDAENITANPAVALKSLGTDEVAAALLANDSGPFKRPLASLTFALNHYFAGGFESAFPFKLTNVLIHIINALLVLVLVSRLLGTSSLEAKWPPPARRVASVGCALLWALHPIQLTSVAYVVQRMTSLSATFVLLGLIVYLSGRRQLTAQPGISSFRMSAGLIGGTLLGVSVKETAVLLPVYALVLELVLFDRRTLDGGSRRTLWIVYAAALATPVILLGGYLLAHPRFLSESYSTRTYTPWERIITEARVLWYYVGLILYPVPSRFGLFHDDIVTSTGLLAPPTTLLACVGWLIAVIVSFIARRRYPLAAIGVLWFLAGHSLESGVVGLELAHEHRNYLPSLGPILFAAAGLCTVGNRLLPERRGDWILLISVTSVIAFSTWVRSAQWSELTTLAFTTVQDHPDSPRANDFAARVALNEEGNTVAAIAYTLRGLRLRPNEAGFHLDLHLLLAIQSSEMGNFLDARSAGDQIGQPIEVQLGNLSEAFLASRHNGHWSLQHQSSPNSRLRELLSSQTLSVHAVVSLEMARQCAMREGSPCARYYEQILGWHVAAAENPRTSREYRGIIAAGAARLSAGRGDYKTGLQFIRRAIEFSPDELAYRIGETEYLLRLGQYPAAEHTLSLIRNGSWPRSMVVANRTSMQALERLRLKTERPPGT